MKRKGTWLFEFSREKAAARRDVALAGGWPIAGAERMPMQHPVKKDQLAGEDLPLAIEPIVAWRCWNVAEDGGVFLLRSITYKVFWQPRSTMTAECLPRANGSVTVFAAEQHEPLVPCFEHGCGLYSVKTPEQVQKWGSAYHNPRVYGTVKIWGRVFRCTDGYLSQFAYPASLVIAKEGRAEEHAEALAELYGVPVFREFGEALEAAA